MCHWVYHSNTVFVLCDIYFFRTVIKANFVSADEGSVTIFPYDVIKEKNIATTNIFSHLLQGFFD